MNIFDFIAFLLKDTDSGIYSRYAGRDYETIKLSDDENQFLLYFIDSVKSFYEQKNENYYTEIIRDGIPAELYNKYLQDESFRNNKDAVFLLARKIADYFLNYDNLLEASKEAYALEKRNHGEVGFKQLNTNESVEETGFILLPNLGTFGEGSTIQDSSLPRKKIVRSTTYFEKVRLNGLIILTPEDLRTKDGQQYEVRNVLPESGSHQKRYDNFGLTIAVSPLSNQWLLKDEPEILINEYGNEEYRFKSAGVTDKEYITSRVSAAYQEACANNADLLLFPEMYGTEDLSLRAYDFISSNSVSSIPLVVMPSWWHENLNESPVLNNYLITMFSQAKYTPFLYDIRSSKYPMPSLENIQNSRNVVYMYHFPKIGRICVCICKDFLRDTYRRMLYENLEASFILIPAFSPSIDHFLNCMDELRHAGTYGVFVNCCAARSHKSDNEHEPITDKDIIGKVSVTRTSDDINNPPYSFLRPKCEGKCSGRDTCCVFIIRISNEGNISVEHIYKHSP